MATEFSRPAGGVGANDIFHDPFIDGPLELVPLKTILWAQQAQPDSAAAGESAVPNLRVEAVEAVGLGDTAQALRLITRAYAATALDDPTA